MRLMSFLSTGKAIVRITRASTIGHTFSTKSTMPEDAAALKAFAVEDEIISIVLKISVANNSTY